MAKPFRESYDALEFGGEGYFDDPDFKSYQRRVEAIILSKPHGMTTHAEVKAALGESFRPEWILDAIRWSSVVEDAWSARIAWQPKKFKLVFTNNTYNTPEAVIVVREEI